MPYNNRYYCPLPDCGLFVDKSKQPLPRATCPRGHVTCVNCHKSGHNDADQCAKNNIDEPVESLAREEGWKHCYKCNELVEHYGGCIHMRCGCGAEFCYVCGRKWRSYDCRCTNEDLAAVTRGARENAYRQQEQEERNRETNQISQEHQRSFEADELDAAPAASESRRKKQIRTKYQEFEGTLDKFGKLQKDVLHEDHQRESNRLKSAKEEALATARQADKAEVEAEMWLGQKPKFDRNWKEDDRKSGQNSTVEEMESTEDGERREKLREAGTALCKRERNTYSEGIHKEGKPLQMPAQQDEEDTKRRPLGANEEDVEIRFEAQRHELQNKNKTQTYWLELMLSTRHRLLLDHKRVELRNGVSDEHNDR